MSSIHPSRDRLESLVQRFSPEEPVVMLNLLRFREEASYAEETDERPCSGREAYARYSKLALGQLARVGARPEWMGQAMAPVIAPHDEDWDEVLLVRYPSAQAFLNMVAAPEYRAIVHHRTAALADSRLIAMRPQSS
ncbi:MULTISPECIES: DUF1330 domain-containing protein [Marinobacter]|uniref:DUF1330 domain-containing protein n=1 Tax=Marinobacter TaxID=2742 RepID=UPI000DAD2208|nr:MULTISPECIES: DUF1330 domain-containing protein [Marinobacter]